MQRMNEFLKRQSQIDRMIRMISMCRDIFKMQKKFEKVRKIPSFVVFPIEGMIK